MKPLRIITTNNSEDEKILRSKSTDISMAKIQESSFQSFLDQLELTLIHGVEDERLRGVGISAVQVGNLINVFIAYDVNTNKYIEYINPKIELKGSATDTRDEVCLSIPDIIGEVERHKRIKLVWVSRDGREYNKEFSGFNARIIQHEYDHLQGVLFTDKLANEAREI